MIRTRRPGRIAATAVLVGMLAVPGMARGQEVVEPAQEEEVAGSIPDSLLAGRLRTILSNVEEFVAVEVSVTEGVVRLAGAVDHPDTRRQVEELAARLEGVVYVVNDVAASTDVETRIMPAVSTIQRYWDGFISQMPVLGVALIVVLLFWAASFTIGLWKRPASWTGINPLVWGFVSRLVRGLLVTVGLLLAFDIVGITSLMGAVLGTAGIVGLAIGFAFQDIVENYLAGMLLSLRRPFSVNDVVRVGEFEGRIVRLTSRELVLFTFEGNHVRLPNALVFKSPLTNYSINPRRLFDFDVGIGVHEDVQVAANLGVATLDAMKGVMEDPPPFARVQQLGDSTVTLSYHGWVDQREADFLKVRSEAIRLVKTALDRASVEMPEPTYRVLTRALPERKSPESSPEVDTQAIDVQPDGKLDAQVIEDLERSDDENLLT